MPLRSYKLLMTTVTPYLLGSITTAQWLECADETMELYQGCITPVSVPSQEPDFCYAALLAHQDCITQAQNLDPEDPNALSFAMECRQKSGIDLCQ